jgi:mutator protein MutT
MDQKHQRIIVSGVLFNKSGEVFLTKRSLTKTIAPGKYHLPGGHVDFGEAPEEALIREFVEEFRLSVKPIGIIRVFSYVYDTNHTIGITYAVEAQEIPENIWFDTNDNEEVCWVGENEYVTYLGEVDHDTVTLDTFWSMVSSQ